jgi:hypothetical protein
MVHIVSNQKSQFFKDLEGLAMEDAGMFYGHLAYFTAHQSIYFNPVWSML